MKLTRLYTVEYNANDGGGAPSNQTKTHEEDLTLSSTIPTRSGYTFTGWNTASDGSGEDYASGATYSANEAVTLYAQWEGIVVNSDTSGANEPVIATGLQATHSGIHANGDLMWANAQTADGSLYVWIPRYTYKIISSTSKLSRVKSWNSLDNPGTGTIKGQIGIKFSNGTSDDTSGSYLAHPAFTFGSTQLTEIWVAKYEASRNDAMASSAGSGTTVSSKPGVVSWEEVKEIIEGN